jgi:signal transduction histidine kinase
LNRRRPKGTIHRSGEPGQASRRFELEGQRRARRGARIYCAFGVVMLCLSAAYSWTYEPFVFPQLLRIRLETAASVAFAWWFLGTAAGGRRASPVLAAVMILMSLAMHRMASFEGGQLSSQYDRMSLVILGSAVLMTWSPLWSALACTGVVAVFVAGSTLTATVGAPRFAENLSRLLAASVATVGATGMREKRRRGELEHELDLTETHRRAEEQIRRFEAQAQALERALARQKELAHVQRITIMGEMAAQIAHEVNQPLSAIVNFASGLRRRLLYRGADPEIVDAVSHIADEGLRAGEILRRVRNFLRPSADAREVVDVNRLVREAVALAELDARQNHIEVSVDLDASLGMVLVDPIQIEQVILNLLRNAIEAMAACPGGDHQLSVQTVPAGDQVEVHVRDTGVGVDPDAAGRIFDAFFTTKPLGLGMGLSVSRSIVEAHAGRLWSSVNSDRGMTFTVALPVCAERVARVAS